ncbi:MAG: hypothetical protein ACKVX7_12525 [Planctomycetota bacterium]
MTIYATTTRRRNMARRAGLVLIGGVLLALFAGFLNARIAQDEPAGEGEKQPAAPSATRPTPEFADDESRAAFARGVELFDKGDWKAADGEFTKCQKGATSKVSKAELKLWTRAVKGGPDLAKIEKAIDKKDWKGAWGQLTTANAKYADTPLKSKLDELTKVVEPELFLVLASFEEPPPEPEKLARNRPATASFNDDVKFVKSGKRSMRWSEGSGFANLQIARLEGGIPKEYRYLNISIYSSDDKLGKYTIFFPTGELGMNPMEILKTRCFFHHLTINKPGWHNLRIDLTKDLATHSNPTRDEIEGLNLLVIPPGQPKTIYIDDVKLEKE